MPVIAVVNPKGGSGKSTLATHLAGHGAALGACPGHRDGDVIGVWSTWMSHLTSVPCTLVTVTVTP